MTRRAARLARTSRRDRRELPRFRAPSRSARQDLARARSGCRARPVRAGRRWPDRRGPAAWVVDQQPVPLGDHRVVVDRRGRPTCRRVRPGRAHPTLARAFGPGTAADIRWWTGRTVAEARRALGELGAVDVELDAGTGYVRRTTSSRRPTPVRGSRCCRHRSDRDGLDGARLVSRRASLDAVRPNGNAGPDDLVRRPGRRRLGTATRRRDRGAPARGYRRCAAGGRRGRGRSTRTLAGVVCIDAALQDAARARPRD